MRRAEKGGYMTYVLSGKDDEVLTVTRTPEDIKAWAARHRDLLSGHDKLSVVIWEEGGTEPIATFSVDAIDAGHVLFRAWGVTGSHATVLSLA